MLDAVISLFIAAIAAVAVLGFASAVLRQEGRVRARAVALIESRNETAFAGFVIDEP